MIIKDVKYSYIVRKYKLGPYVDFFSELEVPSTDYDSIVSVIQKARPKYEQIKLMYFSRK